MRYYEIYTGSDTSDDTKELEKRLNNIHSLQSSKKTRTIPSPAEKNDESPHILAVDNDMMDSSSAGPSSY